MITEAFQKTLNTYLKGQGAGVFEDLAKLPNNKMRADLQKMVEEKIIWQTRNAPSKTLKFTFKYCTTQLPQILAFCAKYQIQEQKTNAARQRKTYSTKNNPLYKNLFLLKFEESGSKSAGVNKGDQFEGIIANRVTAQAGKPIELVQIDDPVIYDIMKAGRIVKILEPAKMRGKERNKRSIDISNPPEVDADIGDTISDVDVVGEDIHGNRVVVHLSCKKGAVINYINCGVKTQYLIPKEIKAEKITNKKGRALLDMLGIKEGSMEEELFFAIFNEYNHFKNKKETHSKVIDLTAKMSKTKVARLIGVCMGKGYVLVHELGNKIYVTRKDDEELRKYVKITKAWADFCLGKKQLKIVCEMSLGKSVEFSIRNTLGNSVYPSHFMLYWRKDKNDLTLL